MKRLTLMLLVLTLLISCKKESNDNFLIGTKWTAIDEFYTALMGFTCNISVEFVNGTECQEISQTINTKVFKGTYTFKADSVSWTTERGTIRGKISGNILTSDYPLLFGGTRQYIKE